MMITSIDTASIDLLTEPQPRLPQLKEWLSQQVWTSSRFHQCGGVPSEYLNSGEKLVNETESLLTAAADSYFGELAAARASARPISDFLKEKENAGAVVLDGCSIREMPKFMELAQASRRPVVECTYGCSAIPSTTEHFICDRLGLGLPAIAPSQMVSRRELMECGIRYHFFQTPNESQHIPDEPGPILLWHRFPDLRFMDSTASSAEFYDGIWDNLEMVWQRTVQALPASSHVLVTSDHGYVFLGPGLSDINLVRQDRPLKGKRFYEFPADENMPQEDPGLFIDQNRRLAAVKGRFHNRPQAPHPAQSLYRHGGVSLMEVLTPWLVLGPME
jgi:hypothetical protein